MEWVGWLRQLEPWQIRVGTFIAGTLLLLGYVIVEDTLVRWMKDRSEQ